MSCLTHLSLESNSLFGLRVGALDGCCGLQMVSFARNKLSGIDADVFGPCADALTDLALQSNALETLPDSLTRCRSLQTLLLHQNRICSLPDSFGEALTRLEHLTLDDNRLTRLPAALSACSRCVRTCLRVVALSPPRRPHPPPAWWSSPRATMIWLRSRTWTWAPWPVSACCAWTTIHVCPPCPLGCYAWDAR